MEGRHCAIAPELQGIARSRWLFVTKINPPPFGQYGPQGSCCACLLGAGQSAVGPVPNKNIVAGAATGPQAVCVCVCVVGGGWVGGGGVGSDPPPSARQAPERYLDALIFASRSKHAVSAHFSRPSLDMWLGGRHGTSGGPLIQARATTPGRQLCGSRRTLSPEGRPWRRLSRRPFRSADPADHDGPSVVRAAPVVPSVTVLRCHLRGRPWISRQRPRCTCLLPDAAKQHPVRCLERA